MFLVRLIYASTITEHFSHTDIEKILASAVKNNGKNNVTGLLCFNRKYFLQCLEGSRQAVNMTYRYILNDKRHDNIMLMDYQEVAQREFDSWKMGYVPESSLASPINMKYSGSPEFDPYSMSGESAHKMMITLRGHIPVV